MKTIKVRLPPPRLIAPDSALDLTRRIATELRGNGKTRQINFLIWSNIAPPDDSEEPMTEEQEAAFRAELAEHERVLTLDPTEENR